jgi:hypothetical protein
VINASEFDDNFAIIGGAVYASGTATFEATTFDSNLAGLGGGLYTQGHPVLTGCTFVANTAALGAGVYNNGGSPNLTDCVLTVNAAELDGGGMYDIGVGVGATLTRCVFDRNRAARDSGGGGGMCIVNSSPTLTGCIFLGNGAGRGGAMLNESSSPKVVSCVFRYNHALVSGGCSDCPCQPAGSGGAMVNVASMPVVTNCTFSDNSDNCIVSPGAAFLNSASVPVFTNCILSETPLMAGDAATVTYSAVSSTYAGEGNIDFMPWFDVDDELHPIPGSPLIDAGDTSALIDALLVDADGNPRLADDSCHQDTGNAGGDDAVVDMGAFEFQGSSCDLDGNGAVGVTDFLRLLALWGACAYPCPVACPGDFDGNCAVGLDDFAILLDNWG